MGNAYGPRTRRVKRPIVCSRCRACCITGNEGAAWRAGWESDDLPRRGGFRTVRVQDGSLERQGLCPMCVSAELRRERDQTRENHREDTD